VADQPILDTIEFYLLKEHTIVNDTVRLVALVSGTIDPDLSEVVVKENVRALMKRLIPSANWQFSGMTRGTHASGREELSVTATTRVSEAENYALERRARTASEAGLTIASVYSDTTPPQSMVNEAESNLRKDLLRDTAKEIAALNEIARDMPGPGAPYRLHALTFETGGGPANIQAMSVSNRGGATMQAHAMNYGSGMGDDGTLGNATKVTMRARVRLGRV